MADMNCLNNEDELVSQLDSDSQIDSTIDNESDLSGNMENVIEISRTYKGLESEDIIVSVDNSRNEISAELKTEVKETISNNTANIEALSEVVATNTTDIEQLSTDKADKTEIPTKVSQLENDSKFTTEDYVNTNGGKIDKIIVNNVEQPIVNKAINLTIPTKLSELSNDTGFINNTVNNLVNYYTKSETYTKSEVLELVNKIPKFSVQIVSALPTTGISSTTIYLLSKTDSNSNDYFDEYLYINNSWELIGSTKVDLTGYYTKTEVNTLLTDLESKIPNTDRFTTTEQLNTTKTELQGNIDSNTNSISSLTTIVNNNTNALSNKATKGELETLENNVAQFSLSVSEQLGVIVEQQETADTNLQNQITEINNSLNTHIQAVEPTIEFAEEERQKSLNLFPYKISELSCTNDKAFLFGGSSSNAIGYCRCNTYIPIQSNTTYSFALNGLTDINLMVVFYDKDKIAIQSNLSQPEQGFISVTNAKYMRFSVKMLYEEWQTIMMNKGDTLLDYTQSYGGEIARIGQVPVVETPLNEYSNNAIANSTVAKQLNIVNTNITNLQTSKVGYTEENEGNEIDPSSDYVTKTQLLDLIYPVGSCYISYLDVDPSLFIGGTWSKYKSGYALWTAESGGGETINAGLPNITGYIGSGGMYGWGTSSGAFIREEFTNNAPSDGGYGAYRALRFDANQSNSIYGNSDTVQPPAVKIYLWYRTA